MPGRLSKHYPYGFKVRTMQLGDSFQMKKGGISFRVVKVFRSEDWERLYVGSYLNEHGGHSHIIVGITGDGVIYRHV